MYAVAADGSADESVRRSSACPMRGISSFVQLKVANRESRNSFAKMSGVYL